MMTSRPLLPLAALLMLSGCASDIILPPTGLDHPANPDAVAAPEPPPSSTLAIATAPPAKPPEAAAPQQDHALHQNNNR